MLLFSPIFYNFTPLFSARVLHSAAYLQVSLCVQLRHREVSTSLFQCHLVKNSQKVTAKVLTQSIEGRLSEGQVLFGALIDASKEHPPELFVIHRNVHVFQEGLMTCLDLFPGMYCSTLVGNLPFDRPYLLDFSLGAVWSNSFLRMEPSGQVHGTFLESE